VVQRRAPRAGHRRGAPGAAGERARSARVYDYWLGGKENYAADRAAGDQITAARPEVVADVRANRDFMARAVRFLAAEAGIDQFLDVGAGLPAARNVHDVAQRARPGSKVVYADNDPVVLAHGRALLRGAADGTTAYVGADLRETDGLLREAGAVLDLDRPVAVTLLLVLPFLTDAEEPGAVVGRLVGALAPGSHLVLSHPADDVAAAGMLQATERYNELVDPPMTRRGRREIEGFFAGLDLVDPGLVELRRWRPDEPVPGDGPPTPALGGVARKP
jgi:O-methyltransferase involved in polyketide biosynthesis